MAEGKVVVKRLMEMYSVVVFSFSFCVFFKYHLLKNIKQYSHKLSVMHNDIGNSNRLKKNVNKYINS